MTTCEHPLLYVLVLSFFLDFDLYRVSVCLPASLEKSVFGGLQLSNASWINLILKDRAKWWGSSATMRPAQKTTRKSSRPIHLARTLDGIS